MQVIYPAIQKHTRTDTAAQTGVVALPLELLVAIFARLPFRDRIRAALVCHQWRSVSLDAPAALWSDFPSILNMDAYRSLLSRSRNLPITLRHQQVDPEAVALFSQVLKDHLHRVEAIHLVLAEPCMADAAQWDLARPSHHLADALLGPAPHLKSLCISDYYGEFSATYLDLPILQKPTLRNIELHGFYLSSLRGCAGSQTLRRLKISTPQDYYELLQDDWSVLFSFPQLEAVAVHLACVDRLQSRRTPFPGSLKDLHLELTWDAFRTLISVKDLDPIHTLRLSFLDDLDSVPSLDDLRPFFPDPMVTAAIHFDSSESNVSMKAVDEHGRQRIFRQLRLDDAWCRWLPKITALSLSMVEDPPSEIADAVGTFPFLRELSLDVTTSEFEEENPQLDQWPRIVCPELHTVRFAAAEHGPPLPVNTITAYLDELLRPRRPHARLSRLIFDRVSLVSSHGVDVSARLHAFADTVYMGPSNNAWAEEDWRVWNKDWDALSDCY